jgi:hypothetical protein
MDTLKKIAPAPYRVDIAAERLTIKRLTPGDLPEFSKSPRRSSTDCLPAIPWLCW